MCSLWWLDNSGKTAKTSQLLQSHCCFNQIRNYCDLCVNSQESTAGIRAGKKERSFRRPSPIARMEFFSWIARNKSKKYLTIYLQCPTLHNHITAFGLNSSAIFWPLYFGRWSSSCTTWQHRHASFREGLIWRADLNDGGRNVIHRYDLNIRKWEIEKGRRMINLDKYWLCGTRVSVFIPA